MQTPQISGAIPVDNIKIGRSQECGKCEFYVYIAKTRFPFCSANGFDSTCTPKIKLDNTILTGSVTGCIKGKWDNVKPFDVSVNKALAMKAHIDSFVKNPFAATLTEDQFVAVMLSEFSAGRITEEILTAVFAAKNISLDKEIV